MMQGIEPSQPEPLIEADEVELNRLHNIYFDIGNFKKISEDASKTKSVRRKAKIKLAALIEEFQKNPDTATWYLAELDKAVKNYKEKHAVSKQQSEA